jgi:NADH-quinone oxidoreductase subunit J
MLTRDMMNPNVAGRNRQWLASALVAVALCGVLVWAVLDHGWGATPGPVPEHSIALLGQALVDPQGFVLPFEVASVLLLVALVGAVTIARER